jgi:hypothetical protein
MDGGEASDLQAQEYAWTRTNDFLARAMREEAFNIGGEPLLAQVTEQLPTDGSMPPAEILELLIAKDPKAAHSVMDRFEAIGEATRQKELDEFNQPTHKLRRWGRALLEGAASINIMGTPPRRKR